jgi:hypothetical protein
MRMMGGEHTAYGIGGGDLVDVGAGFGKVGSDAAAVPHKEVSSQV